MIEQILLDGIQAITAFARENEDEFVELVSSRSRAAVEKSIREAKHEQEQAQARIHKLDGVIQRLYEDNVEGKISEERFAKMAASYEEEQASLKKRIRELSGVIMQDCECTDGAERFLTLVRKYTDIQSLDAALVREFIEKAYVYHKETVDGKKVQRVRIIWNCIGEFTPPQPLPEAVSA